MKSRYVEDNAAILRDQAEDFYRGIIVGIDPEVSLEFAFAGDAGARR
ncbi:hypothetical protein [Microbacterium rhizophilus]